MTNDDASMVSKTYSHNKERHNKLTYWRSAYNCFSIEYKGTITDICEGDLGYGDMDRLDGAIHAAIECKRKMGKTCTLEQL